MASFPKLNTGAVTQYPSERTVQTNTKILRYLDGSEQRYRERPAPALEWKLQLQHVTEEELAAIEEFFAAQQGRFGQFSFTDPWTGTEHTDCSFDEDSLNSQLFGEEWAGTTLVIRTN